MREGGRGGVREEYSKKADLPEMVDGVAKGALGCYVARMVRVNIHLMGTPHTSLISHNSFQF